MLRFAGLFLACVALAAHGQADQIVATPRDRAPIVFPRASQYDLVSKTNGQGYRIMVAVPPNYDKEKAYPALYILEGNVYFATAAEAMARQSIYRSVAPALVIGIGYSSDDTTVSLTRRWLDLTPSVSSDPAEKRKTGGGDEFLRVIDEEVKPFVASRYKIDASRQVLWGHSLGGLIVLRAPLRHTESFSTYLISSPAIWWEDNMVLRDEAAFGKRVAEVGTPIRVLIMSAGEEQYRGDDAKLMAAAAKTRMVDNASELAARLGKINPERLTVQRYVLEGENHITVSHVTVTRSLRFAFPYTQR